MSQDLPVPLPDKDISPEFVKLWDLIGEWHRVTVPMDHADKIDRQVHAMLESYARACMAPLQEENAQLVRALREATEAPTFMGEPVSRFLPCGHPRELLLKSAETGEPLYCELCDAQSGRRDAERMEQEYRERADALQAENARLKTVMIAAAEEIHAHWDAHCDAEGYGPQNLQRRLEEGIASEYGYTAGAFAELKARADALEEALRELLDSHDGYAKAHMAETNAINNYSSDQSTYSRATIKASKRLSRAEKSARSLINPTGGES